jgi:hypothetical protein
MAIAFRAESDASRTSTNQIVANKPTGLAVGDLMLYQVVSSNNSSNGRYTLTGWTQFYVRESGFRTHEGLWKIADSADVAASTFTLTCSSATSVARGSLSAFSGDFDSSPIDKVENNAAGNTSSPTVSGITPSGTDTFFLISVASWFTNARTVSGYAVATDNPTWTEIADRNSGGTSNRVNIAVAYGSRPESTASGTGSATLSGNNDTVSITLFNIAEPPQSTQYDQSLTATVAPVSLLTKGVGKDLDAITTTTSNITKSIAKTLSSGTEILGLVAKQTAKILESIVTTTAEMMQLKVSTLILEATTLIAATITSVQGVVLEATTEVAATIERSFGKVLTATPEVTGEVARQLHKTLQGFVVSITGTIDKGINKALDATVEVTGTLEKAKAIILEGVTEITATLKGSRGIVLTATTAVTATTDKLVAKMLRAVTKITARFGLDFYTTKYKKQDDNYTKKY